MAKGKGKKAYGSRKGSAIDLEDVPDDDEASAEGSASTAKSGRRVTWADEEDAVIDAFQDGLDKLFEKRGATRVNGLEELVGCMRQDVCSDKVDESSDTVIDRCKNSLRKGGANEKALAATALSLHFVSLTETSEQLLSEVRPDLEAVSAEGPSSASRSAATEALAMCCFVAAEEHTSPREVMDLMKRLWRQGEAGPRAAALRGWSLLFTSLDSMLGSREVEGLLEEMVALVGDKSVDVRSAAGEVAALMSSSYGLMQQVAGGEEDVDDEEAEEQAAILEEFQTQATADSMVGLVDRMRDLATHNRDDATRSSKRDKASLRTAFRSILASVEGSGAKADKIKLQHGDVLVIDTLPGKLTMAAFKRLLAGGIQAHLQANPLLHSVFRFSPAEGVGKGSRGGGADSGRRVPSSTVSRGRDAERRGERAHKSSSRLGPREEGDE